MVMELWDFGLPVIIEPPEAEQVPTGPRGLFRLWRETG